MAAARAAQPGPAPPGRIGCAAAPAARWTACPGRAAPAASAQPADRHALDGKLERRARPRRLDRVGAGLDVLAGHRPAVAPEQRTDVEDADAAAIEVGFVVAGELLHAVPEIEQPEMAGADVAAAGPEEQLAAALQHVDAHVVEKRTGHLLRPPHADVVAGVRARRSRIRA